MTDIPHKVVGRWFERKNSLKRYRYIDLRTQNGELLFRYTEKKDKE